MATAVETRTTRELDGEQRFLLRGVDWEGYESLLEIVGNGHVRLTYDGEDVELMSPLENHEEYARLIGRIVEAVNDALGLPYRALRTTTWRKKAENLGLEADDCFYLKNIAAVRGMRKNFDLNTVPPPDLAIEIEISRSALDRLEVYAKLNVPEVWRFDGKKLTIHALGSNGRYRIVQASPGVPAIKPIEIVNWIGRAEELDDHGVWSRELRQWVQTELVPRHKRIGGD